jgi:hypothetical protein
MSGPSIPGNHNRREPHKGLGDGFASGFRGVGLEKAWHARNILWLMGRLLRIGQRQKMGTTPAAFRRKHARAESPHMVRGIR